MTIRYSQPFWAEFAQDLTNLAQSSLWQPCKAEDMCYSATELLHTTAQRFPKLSDDITKWRIGTQPMDAGRIQVLVAICDEGLTWDIAKLAGLS